MTDNSSSKLQTDFLERLQGVLHNWKMVRDKNNIHYDPESQNVAAILEEFIEDIEEALYGGQAKDKE